MVKTPKRIPNQICWLCPDSIWFQHIASIGYKYTRSSDRFLEFQDAAVKDEPFDKFKDDLLPWEDIYYYRDEYVYVVKEIDTVFPFELLICPNIHIELDEIFDFVPDFFERMSDMVMAIKEHIKDTDELIVSFKHRDENYPMYIDHLHLHIVSKKPIENGYERVKEFLSTYSYPAKITLSN